MKSICLYFALISFAFAESSVFYATQTTWSATSGPDWYVFSRERLLDAEAPAITPGSSVEQVKKRLGEPEGIGSVSDRMVWSYGLHRHLFVHVVFDGKSRVERMEKTAYRSVPDEVLAVATNIETMSSDALLDLGSWGAMSTVKEDAAADRVQIAVGVARLLHPDMSSNAVERLLGQPAAMVTRPIETVWLYRVGASTFLQISFLSKAGLSGCAVRHYRADNGRLNVILLRGVMEQPQAEDLDLACWRSTWAGYSAHDRREGIGQRMMNFLKNGMTVTALVKILGRPVEVREFPGKTIWNYYLSDASLICVSVDDKKEYASEVRLLR